MSIFAIRRDGSIDNSAREVKENGFNGKTGRPNLETVIVLAKRKKALIASLIHRQAEKPGFKTGLFLFKGIPAREAEFIFIPIKTITRR